MTYWQLKIDRPITGSETFDLRTQSSVRVGDSVKNDICIDTTDVPGSLKVVKRGFRKKVYIQLTDEVVSSLRGETLKVKNWSTPLYSGEIFEATGTCEWDIGEAHFSLVRSEGLEIRALQVADRSEENKQWRQSILASGVFHISLFLIGFVFLWVSKFFSHSEIRPTDIQKVSIADVNKVFSKPKPVDLTANPEPAPAQIQVASKEVSTDSTPAAKAALPKTLAKAQPTKSGAALAAKGVPAKKDVTSMGLFAIQTTSEPSHSNLDIVGLAKGSVAVADASPQISKSRLGIASGEGAIGASSAREVTSLEGGQVESYRGGLGEKIKRGSFQGASIKLVKREIEIRGGLDPAVIRQIIEERLPEVRYCYETALLKENNLQGKIAASWTIQPDGSVNALSSESDEIKSNILHPCIKEQIAHWKFPSPKGGGVVRVKYPFLFSPLGS